MPQSPTSPIQVWAGLHGNHLPPLTLAFRNSKLIIMHQSIRLLLASIISGIVGYIIIVIDDWGYSLVTGHQPPQTLDTYTIINWSISTVLSGAVFVIAYIKITNWLEE